MSGGNSVAGVKNLRAMFETKKSEQSTSPPSRGRSSPNGSITPSNSRPVSKVRSSFVAVERPGEAGQGSHWGLRKQSDVSSMAEIREEALKTQNTGTSNATQANELGLGAILKGSAFEPVPAQLDGSADVMNEKRARGGFDEQVQTPQKTNGIHTISEKAGPKGLKEDNHISGEQKHRPSKVPPTNVNTKASAAQSKLGSEVPKKSPSHTQKSLSSPTIPRTVSSATKTKSAITKNLSGTPSAKTTESIKAKPETKATRAPSSPKDERKVPGHNIKPPSVASKPTAASRAHAQKIEAGKPEPAAKQPTSSRPVKLPSAATAGTASSVARKSKPEAGEQRQPTDRRSINVHTPRVAHVSTKASLAKKASRASMTNGIDDLAKSRCSAVHKPADEGFLARMTRPTASSSQKAHEKVQINSPPRARRPEEVRQSAGRKSLTLNAQEHQPGITASPTVAAVTQNRDGKDNQIAQPLDEGEPGPAEETVEDGNPTTQSQQAEIEVM